MFGALLLPNVALNLSSVAYAASASKHYPIYRVAGSIPSSARRWDYASVDVEAHRLYLASEGVMAVDLRNEHVERVVTGKSTHGVIPLGHGLVAAADAASNTVTIFEGASGQVVATIGTGKPPTAEGWRSPDALVKEAKTGLLVAVNGDSGALALIDLERNAVADSIKVGGELEFAAADGAGNVFVNVATADAVAIVDVPHRRVVGTIPLPGCKEPTGLAYDSAHRLVMSVCDNGLAEFIDANKREVVARLKVGRGADAIFYDPVRQVAFSTSGDEGTMSVIAIGSTRDISLIQTLPTQPGARLGAVDPSTGKVYLPAAQYDRSGALVTHPGLPPHPPVIPQSFAFLVIEPVEAPN
jgi:DNA-binding beta-propeller fold protein YncE